MNSRILWMVGLMVVVGLSASHPAFADMGGLPWETPLQVVVNALNGSTGTLLATLAVMAVGVLALAGRVSWAHAGAVLFGIACIFGAARIVAIFNG
jgi:type IV secretion system protein VirB2